MSITNKLVHFKTKQKFNEELTNRNILETSIVFILDTKEIYTHGLFYDGKLVDLSNIETSILNILDNYATKDALQSKAEDSAVVHKSETETITGVKTFNGRVNFLGNGDDNSVYLSTNTRINVNGTTNTVLGFGSGNFYINHGNYNLLVRGKASRPTYNGSDMALLSDVNTKQNTLISGTNIKTINGESILGSGDIVINSSSEETVIGDGVYAVTSDEKLINYNEADESCIGVALVAGEHRFMIAKANATDGTNTTLYWGNNLYGKDVAGITNISSGSGYIGEGKTYGTDFTTWSTGPVVDFNGAANTAAIIAGYTEHGVSMDARDMCTVLNTFNASDSYNDWYVPACGQLALMYLAKTDINAALAKIGGTALLSSFYWSSSESDADRAWYVGFNLGNVYFNDKYTNVWVRFIRDIKSLKERVDDLESKIKDLNTSSSGANVQAVDTGDVVEDVNVEYATTAYVDGLIGDINTILESIINS